MRLNKLDRFQKRLKRLELFFLKNSLDKFFETYIDLENGKVIKTFALNKYEFQKVLKLLKAFIGLKN
jgi:hypothetical protein